MSLSCLPAFLTTCFRHPGVLLDPRVARRLPSLLLGVLSAAGRRTADVLKEVWGAGQQQLRLVDRGGSPWDREGRRPSHADKRRAVQRQAPAAEWGALVAAGTPVEEIVTGAEERRRRVA